MEVNWYVAYTYPNAERRVHQRLEDLGNEAFLPVREEVHQWSDRKKVISKPLFPNYVFVRSEPRKIYKLLEINQVVSLITFEGRPAIVPSDTIDAIRKMIDGEDLEVASEEWKHAVGQHVTICGGYFDGIDGILMENRGNRRLVVSIQVLNTSLSVNLPANCIVAKAKENDN